MASIEFDVADYLDEISDEELIEEVKSRKLKLDDSITDDADLIWEHAYLDCRGNNVPNTLRELFWIKLGRML